MANLITNDFMSVLLFSNLRLPSPVNHGSRAYTLPQKGNSIWVAISSGVVAHCWLAVVSKSKSQKLAG